VTFLILQIKEPSILVNFKITIQIVSYPRYFKNLKEHVDFMKESIKELKIL
jgi:hypothetical protein